MAIAGGILLAILGFGYDVMFAGIPYQDPTPKMEANYQFHSMVADVIFWSGVLVLMAGSLSAFYSVALQRPAKVEAEVD